MLKLWQAGAIAILGTVSPGFAQNDLSSRYTRLPNVSNDPYALRQVTFGCPTEDDEDKLEAALRRQDMPNVLKMVQIGPCKTFKAGTAVFITDVSVEHWRVKFRLSGDTKEYWASGNAFVAHRQATPAR